MTTKEQLNSDLRDALRSRDELRKTTIRLVLAAIHNAEIDAGSALDEGGIAAVLARQVRQRRESIDEFRRAGRTDLVSKEEAELAVVMGYLPPQLSRDEIEVAARRLIAQIDAKGPADKGKVMPLMMRELRGKAEGNVINAVVSELLARAPQGAGAPQDRAAEVS